jgi:hypothetical protein
MSRLRLWHLMVAVVAAGVLFAAYRLDDGCTGLAALVTGAYVCAGLAACGGRHTGRRLWGKLLLGLLLGPLGVLVAWSNRVPEGWPESGRRDRRSSQRSAGVL